MHDFPSNLKGKELIATEEFEFHEEFKIVRIVVEWISMSGVICDLDVSVYCYDDRAHLIEMVDFTKPRSNDDGVILLADEGDTAEAAGSTNTETINIEFPLIDKATTAMLIYVGGGPRNFSMVSSLICHGVLPRSTDVFQPGGAESPDLFHGISAPKRDYHGMCVAAVYKNRWVEGVGYWATQSIMEPVFTTASKEVEDKCHDAIVRTVPALEKFRPRLYPNVRAVCSSLSSEALPKLKKKFQTGDGLHLDQFMEVIFGQLCEVNPKVMNPNEATYTVAILEEMFGQIDYNGDGACDWDEFTSFAIQQGLSARQTAGLAEPGADELDEYVIEYAEHLHMRDRFLSPSRPIVLCRYARDIRRFLLVTEGTGHVQIFNDRFQPLSILDPASIAALTGGMKADLDDTNVMTANHLSKVRVQDITYLSGKDLYAFTASDHTIGIVKEQVGMGGRRISYLTYNKIYSKYLHEHICWSTRQSLLCTSATNRVIYGWDINGSLPLFHVSRHSDMITDFIAIDELNLFCTSSMDKRVVLWAQDSRRVKAVLQHKRGIRCIDAAKHMLLSVSFEMDARVWDISSKECILNLKGHRRPIAAAKLMCDRAAKEDEYRAITVDECGELRLWNLHVKEKTSQVYNAPCVQTFQMANPEDPIDKIRFIFMPNDVKLSTSNYSNVVAVGTKLLQFVPEKHSKEFQPATCALFSESAAMLAVGVKGSILKYDMSEGDFVNSFPDISSHDLTAMALDGARGRRVYVGCSNGDVHTVNFGTGQILESLPCHSRDITAIVPYRETRMNVFTCSLDGKLKMLEEVAGVLSAHNTVESAFGEGIGVQDLAVVGTVKVVIALSAGSAWGVWSSVTFKKIMVVMEDEPVTAMTIIGASGDERDKVAVAKVSHTGGGNVDSSASMKEHLVTLAIARVSSIVVYTLDVFDGIGSITGVINSGSIGPLYYNLLKTIYPPAEGSINYALSRVESDETTASQIIVGGTDNGYLVFWDTSDLRESSEACFREKMGYQLPTAPVKDRQRPSTADTKASVQTASTNADQNSSTPTFGMTSVPASPIRTRPKLSRMTDLSGQVRAADFGHVDEVRDVCSLDPKNFVRMHKDSVNGIVDMSDHGCLCSLSFDGFARVVNMDTDCLGELILPNLTPKMKDITKRAIVPFPKWKFILERMPIEPHHHKLVHRLLKFWRHQFKMRHYKNSQQKTLKDGRARYMTRLSRMDSRPLDQLLDESVKETENTEEDDIPESTLLGHGEHVPHVADLSKLQLGGDMLESSMSLVFSNKEELNASLTMDAILNRESILQDLQEPPVRISDAPPLKIPTKLEVKKQKAKAQYREFKAQQKKQMDEKLKQSQSTGALTLPQIKSPLRDATSPRPMTSGALSRNVDGIDDSRSETTAVTNTTNRSEQFKLDDHTEELWSMAEAHFDDTDVPNAFSDTSLNQSMSDGWIDEEAHRMLLKVGASEAHTDAYDRVAGNFLLRNPALSTSVEIPALNQLRTSEVSFGSQKDMYKHADKLLTERSKASSRSLALSRHTIVKSRIDQSVKKVGSMIHEVAPAVDRELPLPDFSKRIESEMQAAMAKFEGEMQLRLMNSAKFTDKMTSRRDAEGLKPVQPRKMDTNGNPVPDYERIREIEGAMTSKIGDSDAAEEAHEAMLAAKAKKDRSKASKLVDGNLKDGLEGKLAAAIKKFYMKQFAEENARRERMLNPRRVLEEMGELSAEGGEDDGEGASAAEGAQTTEGTVTDGSGEAKEKESEEKKDEASSEAQRPQHMGRRVIPETLTNRQLAPSYKVSDVQTFLDIFLTVDTDYSGDLDIDEWVKLITRRDAGSTQTMSKQQARMIFLRFDTKGEGYLTVRDLVPIVFNKANKEQRILISKMLEGQIIQKKPTVRTMRPQDVDQLFEHYDVDSIGFVHMSLVRDRVRNMNLPDAVQFAFFESIQGIADDDLVNCQEFGRVFKAFIGPKRRRTALGD